MVAKIFLVFGDSIVFGAWDIEGGWVQRLRKYLDKLTLKEKGDFLVYNCGISGNTSEELLERFEIECKSRLKELAMYEGRGIIMISIGGNDCTFIKSKGDNWVLPEKFAENIEKLIKLAKKFSDKIIFVSFTPCDESKTTPIPWNTDIVYKNEDIKKYNDITKEICEKEKIPFIKIFDSWLKLDYKKWLEDGLHPNSKGHEKIFETVKDFLIKNKII